jgi:hypothetical protein
MMSVHFLEGLADSDLDPSDQVDRRHRLRNHAAMVMVRAPEAPVNPTGHLNLGEVPPQRVKEVA